MARQACRQTGKVSKNEFRPLPMSPSFILAFTFVTCSSSFHSCPIEVEPREAKALYNYTARSAKELSFKKGDIIQVYKRSNDDWWDGSLDGLDGYIPCAYVQPI